MKLVLPFILKGCLFRASQIICFVGKLFALQGEIDTFMMAFTASSSSIVSVDKLSLDAEVTLHGWSCVTLLRQLFAMASTRKEARVNELAIEGIPCCFASYQFWTQ